MEINLGNKRPGGGGGGGGWNLSELVDAFFVHKITTTLLIVWFTPMWYFLVLFLHLQTKEL